MTRRVAGTRRGPTPALSEGTSAPEGAEPDLVVVGRIGRPQGLKGEVTVEVRTDDPEQRFAIGAVLQTDAGPLTVANSRRQGKFLVVHFADVGDRTAAELLRDTLLRVAVQDLPPLADEDEYYDSQLLGLSAHLPDGTLVGEVTDVLHLPGGDVLVIRRAHGAEALVPFVKAIVPTVDLVEGTVAIDPPPGLLDLSDPEP